MPFLRTFIAATVLTSPLTLAALEPPPGPALLPQSFSNWAQQATPPSSSDAVSPDVLNEYGLAQSSGAIYTSGTNQLTIHAWQFKDATGAYGAFTYLRQPGMHPETLGHDGASSGDRYLFWSGTSVVDAAFTAPSPEEKAAITALAGQLPQASGAASIPPSLPHYLPAAQLDPATIRYVIGPAAYSGIGGQLPSSVIDFSQDTEVVTAQYGPPDARGTLTLLLYPTPQIAAAHLKIFDAQAKSSGLSTKRSGPLVAIISNLSPQSAQQLLNAVHFNDYVTINHPEGYVPEGAKLYRLILGITVLVGVLMCAALLLGLFLGGGRALIRMLRGKPVSTVSEEEFISLHLGN